MYEALKQPYSPEPFSRADFSDALRVDTAGECSFLIIDPEKKVFLRRSQAGFSLYGVMCEGPPREKDILYNSFNITGRSIETYDEYLGAQGVVPSQRITANPDRLYVEVGPGFCELLAREALSGRERKPLVLDYTDFSSVAALLEEVHQKNGAPITIESHSGPLSSETVLKRIALILNPDLVTYFNCQFVHGTNLPIEFIEMVTRLGGIHTLLDYQAVGLHRDPETYKGMRQYLASDGLVLSF